MKSMLPTALIFGFALSCMAEEKPKSKPIELEGLKTFIGVWDAHIEIWPEGPKASSIKLKGVETNRAYGEYWIASDFESKFMGQTTKVHSIVGYDLDKKKLVGTVIDHGPYAARLTGDYDKKPKTIRWMTKSKAPNGKPIVQKTTITQTSADERVLVMQVPGDKKDEFTKFMQIKFVKRKKFGRSCCA